MTDIIDETAGWPDVPLIATRDLVLGGEGGPSNKQAIALAARTKFLRERAETAEANAAAALALVDGFRTYRTVSTSAPSGIPRQGEEWIVVN